MLMSTRPTLIFIINIYNSNTEKEQVMTLLDLGKMLKLLTICLANI